MAHWITIVIKPTIVIVLGLSNFSAPSLLPLWHLYKFCYRMYILILLFLYSASLPLVKLASWKNGRWKSPWSLFRINLTTLVYSMKRGEIVPLFQLMSHSNYQSCYQVKLWKKTFLSVAGYFSFSHPKFSWSFSSFLSWPII